YHQFVSKDFIEQYSKSTISHAEDVHGKIEYKLISKSGDETWVEEKHNLIDWNFAPALLCTLRDITEKKEKEASSIEETKQLRNENILLRTSLKERYRFQNIIGISAVMQHVYDQILSAANSDANVSIYGESGTGKELVAKAIHDLSNNDESTFVTINCGAIPEPLMESEFFGYKKGAFTGAVIDKHGFLDLADKGTLFLDEIGEIPLSMQVKLLRAIDGGGYNPIGSHEKHMSNFRIIAATNRDLKKEVIKGNMREDFYYRIQVIPIKLPPLRERKEDLPFLVEHFTQMFSKKSRFKKIPDKIISQIYHYDWGGNIRELQNVLLRFFSTGEFELISLKNEEPGFKSDGHYETINEEQHNLNVSVEKNEKELIIDALKTNNWHRLNTAAQLGISRSTLFRKLKKYRLLLKHTAQY
ncbi:sigma-54 dependent transcriptional regulator, partial [Desulfobacterales bacterium HSG17]|nr:sigma-54 dependent transcriptional regulator [Desulfobacterales bacterium HSG17]